MELSLSKRQDITNIVKDTEKKGTPVHFWWEYKLVQSLWKTGQSFLKTLKIELPYDPAIRLLDDISKGSEISNQGDICNPMFTAALFTIGKTQKQSKRPFMDE